MVIQLSSPLFQNLAMDIRRGNKKHDDMVISEWIKVVMTIWGQELNDRPEAEKMGVVGKTASATFTQTKIYIKPLLKMLKKEQMSDDIRDSLSNMVKYIMHKVRQDFLNVILSLSRTTSWQTRSTWRWRSGTPPGQSE